MTKKNEPLLPGIATQQTARNLIRLYARLKGEVQKATDGEDTFMWATEAHAYMRNISRLMVLLGIDWHPGDIKPVKTRVQSGPLPWSKLRPRILAVLRANREKGWMSYEEIAIALLAREGVSLDQKEMKLFKQRVREGCWFYVQRGFIEKEKPGMKPTDAEKLQRFKLSAKRFTLPAS